MITRDEALEMLKTNVQAENMLKHSLVSEAVLRAIAKHLGKNEEE